ncbi:MAG: ASCH domain-containing protein [Gemmatimonadetes bacterium]|nr:ASCH domain-containing protein [Gemmatimonadota bacterium]
MLIRRQQLDAIREGRVTLQFRRWKRPTVKAGGTLTTAVGVLSIHTVDVVALETITRQDAKAAGYDSLDELRAHLTAKDEGLVYRVSLAFAGADPRIALRAKTALATDERDALEAKLARLDANSRQGPWVRQTLALIRANPGMYSGDLADQLGFERLWLKAQIRKLKALGLTESLEVGYRLSPRGEALLKSPGR